MSSLPSIRKIRKRVFRKRTLNELLVIHLSLVALLLLGWLIVGGPLFQKACFFYAFFGWFALRLANRRAWKRHFRPRAAVDGS
jgi:hypothetical protein